MARLVTLGACILLAGCKCNDDRPYTPFTVSVGSAPSAAAQAPGPDAPAPTADAAPTFAPRPALLAPRRATRWQLEGHELNAPPDRVFERGLVGDFDGDGQAEVVAWTIRADELRRVPPGELWLYAAGKPRRLAELPGFVPTGPSCTLTTELIQTGPRSVTVDSRGTCAGTVLARAPVQSLLVVAPGAAEPVLLGLRLAAPAPGERFDVKLESIDRDDDGHDDALLTASVQAEGTSRSPTATLGWFQRAGRMHREAGEPARSLGKAASTEAVRGKSKKSGPSARQGALNLRRLAASLCAEGSTPRIFDGDGAALKCGDLTALVDRTAEAEVQAALSSGDVLEATAILARADWYFGRISSAQRSALTRSIERATSVVSATEQSVLRTRPAPRSSAPRYSPLAFDSAGALLIHTGSAVVRVSGDPPDEQLLDPEAGSPPWPLEVRSPDGRRWAGVAHACDRSELLFTTHPTSGPWPVRLLAARPGPCGGRASPNATLVPLYWTEHAFAGVIAGTRVTLPADAAAPPDAETHPGSPRSPDGSAWAVATALGMLVLGADKPELWRPAGDGGAPQLSECVVDNGRTRIACVEQGRVRWFRR